MNSMFALTLLGRNRAVGLVKSNSYDYSTRRKIMSVSDVGADVLDQESNARGVGTGSAGDTQVG